MRRTLWGSVTVGVCLISVAAYASLNMKPGLWETATMIDGKKVSAEQKCYLAKDVDHLEKQLRGELKEPKQPCVFANYKQSGNSVTYKMTCTFGGKPHASDVTSTFNGDTSTGTITSGGLVSRLDGKRLGDCTKSSFDK